MSWIFPALPNSTAVVVAGLRLLMGFEPMMP